jgi:RNA polymerase sigma-70 factor (ECF subfamily)
MSRPNRGAAAAARASLATDPALGPTPVVQPRIDVSRDGGGLDALYRAHATWLLGVLRRGFGWLQAEDLVQQTFLRLRGYNGGDIRRPRALLLAVARHAAIEQRRRTRVRAPDAIDAAEFDERLGGQLGDQDAQLLLKQIITALPPKLRDVFVLSRFAGMTYPQIAGQLNISQKTVEARMTRALAHCVSQLRS